MTVSMGDQEGVLYTTAAIAESFKFWLAQLRVAVTTGAIRLMDDNPHLHGSISAGKGQIQAAKLKKENGCPS